MTIKNTSFTIFKTGNENFFCTKHMQFLLQIFSLFFLYIFDDNLLSGVLNISTHAKRFLNVFFFYVFLVSLPSITFSQS